MKTWARLALIGAAALSVIAVPVIAFAISSSIARDSAFLAVVISTALAGISLGVTTVTYWQVSTKMRDYSPSLRESLARLNQTSQFLLERPESKEYVEYSLVQELAAIERRGQAVLGETGVTSIIRIREGLRSANVWSEHDVKDFDLALRARNNVVHGDSNRLDLKELAEACSTMRRLRETLDRHAPLTGC